MVLEKLNIKLKKEPREQVIKARANGTAHDTDKILKNIMEK